MGGAHARAGQADVGGRKDTLLSELPLHHRLSGVDRNATKMRIAYADPQYPGFSQLYEDHPDYAGEVDHT